MYTVDEAVSRIRFKIAYFEQSASRLMFCKWVLSGPVLFAVIAVGSLALITTWMNGAWHDPLFGRPVARALYWYVHNYPGMWELLTWIGPTMNQPQAVGSFGFVVWALSWMLIGGGIKWFSVKAGERAKKLRDQAEQDKETLEWKEQDWRQMEALAQQMENLQNMQNIVMGNISGASTVTVAPNITQQQKQIHTILVRGEDEKPWWTKPTGLIVIGVTIDVLAKFLAGK